MIKYIVLVLSLLLSNCAFVPLYSIPSDDAQWIHSKTGQILPSSIEYECEKKAQLIILGRQEYIDKIDSEYYEKWNEILKVKGGCLYEQGFVFKVKFLSLYCYRLENICDAYKKYRK